MKMRSKGGIFGPCLFVCAGLFVCVCVSVFKYVFV